MGLYDRDYTQYDSPSPKFGMQASDKPAWLILLVLNVVFFLFDGLVFSHDHRLMEAMMVKASTLKSPWLWWQWLSYAFAHGGIWHLVVNMLGLFFFGPSVEQRIGRNEFFKFYLVAALVGGIVHSFVMLATGAIIPMLGASGAVTAIVILFCFYYPNATIYLMMVFPVKAWVAGIGFVVYDIFQTFQSKSMVATDVHLAGAAFAAVYAHFRWNFGRFAPASWFAQFKLNKPKLKIHDPDKKLAKEEAEADRILQKIHEQGEASLTSAERKLLERYSRRMRKR